MDVVGGVRQIADKDVVGGEVRVLVEEVVLGHPHVLESGCVGGTDGFDLVHERLVFRLRVAGSAELGVVTLDE